MSRVKLTVVVVLFALLTIFTTTFVAAKKEDADEFDYGVMIDAGSSGTRTFVYSWQHRELDAKSKQLGPLSRPVTQEGWSKKLPIPISDFGDKPEKVSELLAQTVSFAKDKLLEIGITEAALAEVPIFLGATAGARLMDYQSRVALFDAVRKFYRSDASPFQFKDHYAKVLSGEEEGFFGFLAVNYLQNKILPINDDDGEKKNDPVVTLSGALDMGGASTQITFDTQGRDIMENYFEYSTPDDQRYGIYTISFLQFGLNEWWRRLNDNATDNKPDTSVPIVMKCLNKGMEYEYTNTKTNLTYKVIGTNEPGTTFTECLAENQALLFLTSPCLTSTCSINGAYQPPLPENTTLFAFSGYVSVFNTYGQTPTQTYSPAYIKTLAQKVCGMSRQELIDAYPKADVEFLPRGCGSLTYFSTLLQDAYKFPSDVDVLHAKKSINGTEVSWALGRMVYEVNLRYFDRILPDHPTALNYWIVIAILIVALLVATVLLVRTWSQISKARSSNLLNNDNGTFSSLEGDYQTNSGYV